MQQFYEIGSALQAEQVLSPSLAAGDTALTYMPALTGGLVLGGEA
jgi:hypothetical protein